MPKTEQNRDDDDESERRAVGYGGKAVVEAEHDQLTFGSARTVMATPAMTITGALSAGRTRSTRPWSSSGETRFARIATRPIP